MHNATELKKRRKYRKKYRLDKTALLFVFNTIRYTLTPTTQRNNAILPEMKLLASNGYRLKGQINAY